MRCLTRVLCSYVLLKQHTTVHGVAPLCCLKEKSTNLKPYNLLKKSKPITCISWSGLSDRIFRNLEIELELYPCTSSPSIEKLTIHALHDAISSPGCLCSKVAPTPPINPAPLPSSQRCRWEVPTPHLPVLFSSWEQERNQGMRAEASWKGSRIQKTMAGAATICTLTGGRQQQQ